MKTRPDPAKLNRIVSRLPDFIVMGDIWELKDGDYVKKEDGPAWIYESEESGPGHERFQFHAGVS